MNEGSARHYKLLPGALEAEQRRALATYIPALIGVIAAALIISLLLGVWRGNSSQMTVGIALFTALYIVFLLFVIPAKVKRRLAKCWDSYELEIGTDYIVRRQADTPDLQLRFDEITRVERARGRYLRVIGRDRRHILGIPEGIENFEEILGTISSIRDVTSPSSEYWRRYILYLCIGAVAYLVMLWSKSPFLFTPTAMGLAVAAVWAIWSTQRNPNATRQTRRAVWVYLFLLIPCGQKIVEGLVYFMKK